MSQPPYVHVAEADEVRPVERLPAARPWTQDRVAELRAPGQPSGRMMGGQGPDQGYALTLAEHFEHHLHLLEGEFAEDAIAGCVGIAMARASLFGRAPIKADLEAAFTLFGYLGEVRSDLQSQRSQWFNGCAHDYWAKLAIVDMIPASTLRLTPAQLRDSLGDWANLLAS